MGINQKRSAFVVFIGGMTGQMNFFDQMQRIGIDIVFCRCFVIGGGNKNVVHIKQEATAGTFCDFSHEVDFLPCGFCKCHIGGRVLDQDFATDKVLHDIHMFDHLSKCFVGVGNRKEVVVENIRMGGPSQVFRHH